MKILIVGSGGREHALTWKIKKSPKVEKIFVAPGNGGTAEIAENVDINETEIDKLADFALRNEIDLTVVGPEIPLCMEIVDEFEKRNLKIFGPKREAAKIEGSKAWTKELLQKYNIPCAKSKTFSDSTEAKKYLEEFAKGQSLSKPIILKADGLAAGKGVLICKTKQEALISITQIMDEAAFGNAGDRLVIEEFLEGPGVSVLLFVDGGSFKVMVPACDYKRINDNDEGLNTGGMGVYSPPGFYNKELEDKITEQLIKPTLEALKKEGIEYKGVLYAGVILTSDCPKLLEYNCRFGDPETQVILPRLKSDIIDIFESVVGGKLDQQSIEWDDRTCVGVVLASGGYPENYEKGYEIDCLDDIKEAVVFHAGTKKEGDKLITNGGRVLCLSALGENIKEARDKVYSKIEKINFNGMHYRTDIGLREVE